MRFSDRSGAGLGIAGTLTRAALHPAHKAKSAAPATKVAEQTPIITSSLTSPRPWWAALFGVFCILRG